MIFYRIFSIFFFNKQNFNVSATQYHYFFILIGFLIGNLCGSIFLKTSLSLFFFIIFIVTCFEIFSYIYYKNILKISSKKKFNLHAKPNFNVYFASFKKIKTLYFIKIGILFGIFVDAFKVGS